MKVTKFATWNSIEDFLAGKSADREISYEYSGPCARLDRWAQGQEKKEASQAGDVAGAAGENAANEGAQLDPFYSQEMHATHSLDPTQINEQLTAMGAGVGGATGAVDAAAQQQAARTRNASGFAKDLDQIARDKQKTGAGISEGIAAEDTAGALKLRQEGAAGLQGQFGTNTASQLKAMGQQSEDTMDEVQAGQTGWLQNMDQTISAISKAASAAKPGGF